MDTRKIEIMHLNHPGTVAALASATGMERSGARNDRDHVRSGTKTKRRRIANVAPNPATENGLGIEKTRIVVANVPRIGSVHGIAIASVIVNANVVGVIARKSVTVQDVTETFAVAVEAEITKDVVPIHRDRSDVDVLHRMVCAIEMIHPVRN